MSRMSGVDGAFLAMETATAHMHIAAVLVLEPASADENLGIAFQVERIRNLLEERIHLLPKFRQRILRVPFGLQHSVWADDPNFDMDFHVRRACLLPPGGQGELSDMVAEIAGRPLDMDKPLWELHVVQGLDSGHLALIFKVHHAVVDGVSGAEAIRSLFDLGPVGETVEPGPIWDPAPLSRDPEILVNAVSALLRQPERALGIIERSAGAWRRRTDRNRRLREEEEISAPPGVFTAPMTSLNGTITSHRRIAFAEVGLDEVKLVGKVFGVKVNDVILCAASGALRQALLNRDETAENPLVALVPISTRGSHHGKRFW